MTRLGLQYWTWFVTFLAFVSVPDATIAEHNVGFSDSTHSTCLVWPYHLKVDRMMNELCDAFRKSHGPIASKISIRQHDRASLGRFADKDQPFDVVLVDTLPDKHVRKVFMEAFPFGTPRPRRYLLGQKKMLVVASRNSQRQHISLAGATWLLRASTDDFPETVDDARLRDSVHVYAPGGESWERNFLRRTCMQHVEKVNRLTRRGFYDFRKDITALTGHDLLKAVKHRPDAIGFILYTPDLDLTGLKLLACRGGSEQEWITPSEAPFVQEDYALAQNLYLYVHPKAAPLARAFCDFAISERGAQIVAKYDLSTPWHEFNYHAEKRLAALKSGKGTHISVTSDGSNEKTLGDLATEYVRAKDIVQLKYGAVDSDVIAVGQFVADSPRRELLVLGDRPSEKAMEIHGKKWDSLGRDEDGQPDGTGPAEHVLAGRAVAVIVNPANKLDSLTLGQLKTIFGGEVKDWAIVGGTGLEAADQKVGGATIPINLYGLRANEEATAVFEKECLAREKWMGVEAKADTAEAVAAVSMDPQAMAFVDLSAIPGITLLSLSDGFAASGQNVKVLAITVGTGDGVKSIKPSPENIRNAMYPLSQRLYLYVHPEASETAKNFSNFIATCGGSEETPYADTVKAVMATYHKHGLIPLADAAIERMIKDAMAAAEKKAKADEAKAKKK